MKHQPIQPLPQQLRRQHHETDDSYLHRLLDTNRVPTNLQAAYLRQLEQALPAGISLLPALTERTEHPVGAADTHLATCDTCAATTEPRWVCIRCSGNVPIPQRPHAGPYVCRRHRIWVAPGVEPHQQHPVPAKVLIADRRWQRLLQQRRANIVIGVELDLLLHDWSALTGVELDDYDRFVLMVRCWDQMTRSITLERLTRPERPFQDAHDELTALITNACEGQPELAPLIDGLWALLRPTALLRRSDLATGGITTSDADHTVHAGVTVQQLCGPLQPFDQYYRPVTTSRADRWQHFLQQHTISNPRGGYRWVATKGRGAELTLACPKGHRMTGTANTRHNSFRSEYLGCAVCSGRTALAGFNSLQDRNPAAAAMWHLTRNGTLTPNDVTLGAAAEAWWTCPQGHDFPTPVHMIGTLRLGCPICRNYRVQVGVNDLASTRPDLAAQWHPTRNTLTPQDVTAGSGATVWWVCEAGHEWDAPVGRRRIRGCPVCANVRIIPHVNSLSAANPALAAQLHPTRNSPDTATTVGAGTETKLWWVCDQGHDWEASVVNRSKGRGCPYCRNRRVWPGFNDAATRHPELLTDWDWINNDGFDPAQRLPGTKKHRWCCQHAGHEEFETFSNRVHTGGCPRCAVGDRVARPRGRRTPTTRDDQ